MQLTQCLESRVNSQGLKQDLPPLEDERGPNMQCSQSDSNIERREGMNLQPITSQLEQKPSVGLGGGRKRNDTNSSKTSSRNEASKVQEMMDIDGDGTVSWCERLLVMILAGLLGVKLL